MVGDLDRDESTAAKTSLSGSSCVRPAGTVAVGVAEKLQTLLGSRAFRLFTITWFLFQALWMALSTTQSIAPDEGAHIRTIQLYADGPLHPFLNSQPEDTYSLGSVTRSPSYLYHYLMSFPYRLLPSGLSSEQITIALRLINLVFPLTGLFVFYRALQLLVPPPAVAGLVLWMLANTLMFVFLAGSVSYDNLAFLTCSVVFYYWIKVYQRIDGLDVAKLVVAMFVASLTKFTFLPLGMTLLLALLIRYVREVKSAWYRCVETISVKSLTTIVVGALLLLFGGLFVERYGVNVLRYGSYKPQCDQVLTYDQCLQSALFRRNVEFRDNVPTSRIPDLTFTYKWMRKMKRGVYSIVGHRSTRQAPVVRHGVSAIALLMLCAVARRISRKDGPLIAMIGVVGVYAATLLLHNYHLYQQSGRFGLALQGRYIFPVLGIVYFLGCLYLHRWLKARPIALACASLLILTVFFLDGLPRYIKSTTPPWHTPLMGDINRDLKERLSLFP